jgi:hypothetical protein
MIKIYHIKGPCWDGPDLEIKIYHIKRTCVVVDDDFVVRERQT